MIWTKYRLYRTFCTLRFPALAKPEFHREEIALNATGFPTNGIVTDAVGSHSFGDAALANVVEVNA